jgi:hypothetical protein
MDYTDLLWIKLIVLGVAAFVWGLYTGFNGLPLEPEFHDTPEPPHR